MYLFTAFTLFQKYLFLFWRANKHHKDLFQTHLHVKKSPIFMPASD